MRLFAALILALVMPLSVQAASDDAPTLLLRITAEDPAFKIHVRISAVETNDIVFDDDVALPQNGILEIPMDAPAALYMGELSYTDETTIPANVVVGSRGSIGNFADGRDCPGVTLIAFRVTSSMLATERGGCLVLTHAAQELLAEARDARKGASLARFDIPAPGDADRGVLGGALFEWRGESDFLDAWGRPLRGPEVRYVSSGEAASSTRDAFGASASAEVKDVVEWLRWDLGGPTLQAWSSTGAGFGSADGPGAASVTIERATRYDPYPGTLACALRNELQGRALRAGDTVAARDICARWDGPDFVAAAPIDIEGHRLLPLYQYEESAERTLVARVHVLDGVPYPFAIERYVLPHGSSLRALTLGLDRYEPAGEPIALDGPARSAEPAGTLAPLDPLRGPALGSAGARVPFPLADAADAARADASHRDLQDVLGRPDAALIAAEYQTARDAGMPTTILRWTMLFGASDRPAVAIRCERPDTPLPIAPPARCEAIAPPAAIAGPTIGAPIVGRDALPARATTFAEALARWDATRDSAAGEVMTYASYRAWNDGSLPALAVGRGVPAPLTPLSSDVSGRGDHVALELATGRTLASVALVQGGETLGAAPLGTVGPSTLRAGDGPFADANALPLVVGAGVGLVLLALLGLLLYSRLARARVLDDATRAAIHDVVAAEPGLHASAIRERVGKSGGVGEYHLDVMVREGFLTIVATPGFKRYFLTGTRSPAQMRALAALREGQNEKLLGIIRANPGIELRTLALEAGVSVPFVSKSVQRLAEAGLVEKVQVGRAVAVHAIEA